MVEPNFKSRYFQLKQGQDAGSLSPPEVGVGVQRRAKGELPTILVLTPWASETWATARPMSALSPCQGSPAGWGAAGIWVSP